MAIKAETIKNKNPKNAAPQEPQTSTRFSLSKDDKICGLLLIGFLLLITLIKSKFLNIPYERDEGAYSYYGKLLLDGKVPYKDFYEQKLPGIFYFYGLMVSIFGSTVKEMHIGFLVLNLLSIVLIYLSARRLFTPVAAIISAITYGFVALTPNLSGFTIQAEHGVAFFTCLGIFLFAVARSRQKWYYYLLMGISLGCAFMIKTTGLFMMFWGGLILVADFALDKERNFKKLLVEGLLYCAGAFSVIALLLLIIYAKGSFDEMVFWVYQIPKYYVNRIPFDEGVKYFGYSRDAIVMNHKFMWIHAVLAFVLCLFKNITWKQKFFIITLGACSFMTIVPGYYFYGHYWIQLIPGLAIIGGATCYYLLKILNERFNLKQPSLKYIYLGVFVLLGLLHLSKLKDYYFNPNYELILRNVYGNNPFPETMEIAKYLNSVMKPEDKLAVFGSEPELFIYTNKVSPTRHVFFSTIVASVPEHKEWQREFARDIEKTMPKYFVFYRHNVSLLVQPNTDQYVFDWANKFIAANYKVVGVVEMPDGTLHSNYAWGKDAETFAAKAQNVIFVLERKS